MGNEPEKDQDIDPYLQDQDGLSEAYRQQASEQPSGAMDDKILAASRKAVGSSPARAVAPFSTRWHVPASLAAVLVLSVLVVFNLPDDNTQYLYEPAVEPSGRAVNEIEQVLEQAAVSNQPPGKAESSIDDNAITPATDELRRRESTPESPSMLILQRQMAPAPSNIEDSTSLETDTLQPDGVPLAAESTIVPGEQDARQPAFRSQSAQSLDEAVSVTAEQDTAGFADMAAATDSDDAAYSACLAPRPEVCAEIYMPVCAVRDTGIRCVTTPCDSTEQVEYANACSACADEAVIGYTDGACPAATAPGLNQ